MKFIFKLFTIATISLTPLIGFANDNVEIFNQKCNQCHGPSKDAEEIYPGYFARVQWEIFFKNNRHKRKKDISDILSKEELDATMDYLIKHAADSDKPIAAGVR
jgi:mono/diheme cytochrome c family protein